MSRASILLLLLGALLVGGCTQAPAGTVDDRLVGDACDPSVTCEDGAVCFNGTCRHLCNGNSDCDALTSRCDDGVCRPGSSVDCGNGSVEANEGCDDAGVQNGDGCSDLCQPESGYECQGAPSVCTLICGNGALDVAEECDDGGAVANDGCSVACGIENGWSCSGTPSVCVTRCGDGVTAGFETCDDGNSDLGDSCPSGDNGPCRDATCGDGFLWLSNEACDDGGTDPLDGCDALCAIEGRYVCGGTPSVCTCPAPYILQGGVCGTICDTSGFTGCGGYGSCDDSSGVAVCNCDLGYQDNDLDGTCTSDCTGFACTNATCDDSSGTAICTCNSYWYGPSCDQCRVYVDVAAAGGNDGASWASAYTRVQDGIDQAWSLRGGVGICEVWVTVGDYYIREGSNNDTVQLRSGVHLYGGFLAGDTTLAARLTNSYSRLQGRSAGSPSQRVRTVVIGASDTILDRFIVRRGDSNANGGGIFNQDVTNVVISNCLIRGNAAAVNGGGIANLRSEVQIFACTFNDNSTGEDGGAVASDSSTVTIEGSTFYRNAGGINGGAVYSTAGSIVSITDCTFIDNTTNGNSARGGAVFNGLNADVTLTRCHFTGNGALGTGVGTGGALFSVTAQVEIRDCVFAGNTSSDTGGGMNSDGGAAPLVINTIFVGNVAQRGGAFLNWDDGNPTVINSTIVNNAAFNTGPGIFNNGLSTTTLINSIVWGGGLPAIVSDNGGDAVISYSNLEGGQAACENCAWDLGNISDGGTELNDPLFRTPPAPSSGTWTADGLYDTGAVRTTLTATGAGWVIDSLVGTFVQPSDSDPRYFAVVANDADTITVMGDRSDIGLAGAVYRIIDLHLSAASPCIDAGTTRVEVSADHDGTPHQQTTASPPAGAVGAPNYPDIGAFEYVP